MTRHEKIAKDLFLEGYNCSQAVFCAFSDVTGLDQGLCASLSSSLGGGIARKREVCGAVSGMALVMGALFGNYDAKDNEAKKAHYARVRIVVDAFEKETGSIVCRTLLEETEADSSPVPEKRTTEYYKKRPCADLVALAARILDDYLTEVGMISK